MSRTINTMPYKIQYGIKQAHYNIGNVNGSAFSEFRRDLNRSYRAKSKQMMREGKYDIPKPARNALWLYW
jgi:hypothetical protein